MPSKKPFVKLTPKENASSYNCLPSTSLILYLIVCSIASAIPLFKS